MRLILLFTIFILVIPFAFSHITETAHDEFVKLDDKGFNPEYIEISQGATVTWLISGKDLHWPASNFHPTHSLYPEGGGCIGSKLDACSGLKDGDAFSFKFDKEGTWGMHDHLHPGFTMVVKVVGSKNNAVGNFFKKFFSFLWAKQPQTGKGNESIAVYKIPELGAQAMAQKLMEKCNTNNSKGQFLCYAKEMEQISFLYGKDYAYDVLYALQKIDPTAKGCHFIAHGIGWGSYKSDPNNWQTLIATSRPDCSYGAQMGIIEYYTQSLPDGKLKKEDVPNLCGPNPKADCNHAVGHMMLLDAKNNLSVAIDLCSGTKDPEQQFICFSGMFMERFIGSNLIEHGIIPKNYSNWPSRLRSDEKFCRQFKGPLANACWRELAHPAFYYFNESAKSIFKFCDTASTYDSARYCKIHSIPEFMAVYQNPQNLSKICTLERGVDPNFEDECYRNVVGITISFFTLNESKSILDFCSSLGSNFKEGCFTQIGHSLKGHNFPLLVRQNFCSNVSEKFRELCIEGNRASKDVTID